jgi:hypothetical protein
MRKTLSQVITAAISPEGDSTEQHLRPPDDRIRLAYNTVQTHCPRTNSLLMYMEFQVDTESELEENWDKEDVGKRSVDACEECTTTMRMSKKVASQSQNNARTLTHSVRGRTYTDYDFMAYLEWNVPATAGHS